MWDSGWCARLVEYFRNSQEADEALKTFWRAITPACLMPAAVEIVMNTTRLISLCCFLPDKRISDNQAGEPAEVTICRPQLAYAVEATQGGYSSIMNLGASNASVSHDRNQLGPVTLLLRQQCQGRRLQPCFDLFYRGSQRRWRGIDSWMRHNGKELVKARPGNGPGRAIFSQSCDVCGSGVMPGGILAVGIDEEIGIDGDHPPRPSYTMSRRRSHGAPATSGWRPFPLKLAFLRRKPAELRRTVRTRRNPSTIRTRSVVRCLEASFRASFISVSGISTVVFIWLYVS